MRCGWLLLTGCLWCALGCEDEPVSKPDEKTKPVRAPRAVQEAQAANAQSDAGVPPKVDFQESEFVETERSRDPFRAYAETFVEESKGRVRSQRQVLLSQYAIEELKLIGIVTRAEPAKAMLVDPTGKGHVVRRGQFVGRADVVQAAGQNTTIEVNWRVDRIRDGDIVLVRADPSNPDVPSQTRVIPLRPEGTIVSESK